MRHRKHKQSKLGRDSGHRRCLMANMLKALIIHGRIETTLAKAKALRRYADQMITLAKKNDLASRRQAIAQMMVRYNTLTPKEQRDSREGDTSSHNDDRRVIELLFGDLGTRFAERQGGYTRIIKTRCRIGDNAECCIIEYLAQ
jgi:large subunit ribosomal protein L17